MSESNTTAPFTSMSDNRAPMEEAKVESNESEDARPSYGRTPRSICRVKSSTWDSSVVVLRAARNCRICQEEMTLTRTTPVTVREMYVTAMRVRSFIVGGAQARNR